MRTEATFSVDFVMRKKKSDPHRGYIYARIRVDGDIKELSLKEEVSSESWIPGSECLKGRAAEVQKINNYIEDVRSKIRQKYRELHDSGKRMSADLVKQA